MDVATVSMKQTEARRELNNYLGTLKDKRTEEDEAIIRAYKEVLKGRQLLNIVDAMKLAGTRESDGYPVLAICRADEERCQVDMRSDGGATFAGLQAEDRWGHRSLRRRVRLPADTLPRFDSWKANAETMVPLVPPHLRPKAHLRNFHLLWEVDEWKMSPPRDPMLLKRLGGDLFAVLAVWDLTEVERAVLAGRR